MSFLLDANVLIALTHPEHEHHDRARRWVAATEAPLAVCPMVEGALVRFMIRIGHAPGTVALLLSRLAAMPGYEWWPDSVSYSELDLSGLRGHRQVTDAYLVTLAMAHGAQLATFDGGLSVAHPEGALLIPG